MYGIVDKVSREMGFVTIYSIHNDQIDANVLPYQFNETYITKAGKQATGQSWVIGRDGDILIKSGDYVQFFYDIGPNNARILKVAKPELCPPNISEQWKTHTGEGMPKTIPEQKTGKTSGTNEVIIPNRVSGETYKDNRKQLILYQNHMQRVADLLSRNIDAIETNGDTSGATILPEAYLSDLIKYTEILYLNTCKKFDIDPMIKPTFVRIEE